MGQILKDDKYVDIVSDILDNEKFNLLKEDKHHGLTRYDHSVKVSYYSYKLSKLLNLNYIETARAGLLHDFFNNDDLSLKKQRLSAFYHPFKALENSCEYYDLSEREKNIIVSHMFPLVPTKIPKYFESWVVTLVDKCIATYEFAYSYCSKASYKMLEGYMVLLLVLRVL